MSTEVWAIISAAIVILIAIATSHRALRQEMNQQIAALRQEMNESITGLRQEMNERFGQMDESITALRQEMNERLGKMGERMEHFGERLGQFGERLSRVEGLLEAIGHVVHKRNGKERADGEHPSPRPQP